MGQYFNLINEDKKEYISGGKLWEWIANINECGLITSLIMDRWSGDRVVLIGDYDESKLYNKAEDTYKDISSYAVSLYNKNRKLIKLKTKLYAVNETTKEYIYGTFKQISMCLTLVLRKSSGDGGGDIYKDYETAGIWTENKIIIQKERPSDKYKDINSAVYRDAFDFYNG